MAHRRMKVKPKYSICYSNYCVAYILLRETTRAHLIKMKHFSAGAPFNNMDLLKSQYGEVITCLVRSGKKLLIHFQTSKVAPVKVGKIINFTPHVKMDMITYPC